MKKIVSILLAFCLAFSVTTAVSANGTDDYYVGDVNRDGKILATDAFYVLQYSVNIIESLPVVDDGTCVSYDVPTSDYKRVGDACRDDSIDVTDALYILQFSIGLIEKFPAGLSGCEPITYYYLESIEDFEDWLTNSKFGIGSDNPNKIDCLEMRNVAISQNDPLFKAKTYYLPEKGGFKSIHFHPYYDYEFTDTEKTRTFEYFQYTLYIDDPNKYVHLSYSAGKTFFEKENSHYQKLKADNPDSDRFKEIERDGTTYYFYRSESGSFAEITWTIDGNSFWLTIDRISSDDSIDSLIDFCKLKKTTL